MRLALNMAKVGEERFSRAAVEETQHLIKIPWTEVREEKKRGVVIPGHNKVKPAIERHPAMVRENRTYCGLRCQNGTGQNPQNHGRHKGTGVPQPQPAQLRPRTPPVPPDDSEST